MRPCSDLQEIEDYEMRKELRAQGKEETPQEISEVSDPNVITPGTEFMEKLSQALEYYIRGRFNSDPWWRDIMVCSCALVNAIYVLFFSSRRKVHVHFNFNHLTCMLNLIARSIKYWQTFTCYST